MYGGDFLLDERTGLSPKLDESTHYRPSPPPPQTPPPMTDPNPLPQKRLTILSSFSSNSLRFFSRVLSDSVLRASSPMLSRFSPMRTPRSRHISCKECFCALRMFTFFYEKKKTERGIKGKSMGKKRRQKKGKKGKKGRKWGEGEGGGRGNKIYQL